MKHLRASSQHMGYWIYFALVPLSQNSKAKATPGGRSWGTSEIGPFPGSMESQRADPLQSCVQPSVWCGRDYSNSSYTTETAKPWGTGTKGFWSFPGLLTGGQQGWKTPTHWWIPWSGPVHPDQYSG